MNTLFKLEIPKRSTHCVGQGERFQPGMVIYSLLIDEELPRILRRDYCSDCWKKAQITIQSSPNRGFWKSKIEEKPVTIESTRTEKALHLLRSLIQSPDAHEAEIFVLSLFLAHARQLVLRKEFVREDGTYNLYEICRQDEFVTVKVIQLSDDEVKSIQKILALKLQE